MGNDGYGRWVTYQILPGQRGWKVNGGEPPWKAWGFNGFQAWSQPGQPGPSQRCQPQEPTIALPWNIQSVEEFTSRTSRMFVYVVRPIVTYCRISMDFQKADSGGKTMQGVARQSFCTEVFLTCRSWQTLILHPLLPLHIRTWPAHATYEWHTGARCGAVQRPQSFLGSYCSRIFRTCNLEMHSEIILIYCTYIYMYYMKLYCFTCFTFCSLKCEGWYCSFMPIMQAIFTHQFIMVMWVMWVMCWARHFAGPESCMMRPLSGPSERRDA